MPYVQPNAKVLSERQRFTERQTPSFTWGKLSKALLYIAPHDTRRVAYDSRGSAYPFEIVNLRMGGFLWVCARITCMVAFACLLASLGVGLLGNCPIPHSFVSLTACCPRIPWSPTEPGGVSWAPRDINGNLRGPTEPNGIQCGPVLKVDPWSPMGSCGYPRGVPWSPAVNSS